VKPQVGHPPAEYRYNCNKADLLALYGELKRAAAPRPASLLAGYTGGISDGVLRKRALENAIERIGRELHTQYVASYTPPAATSIAFHAIRVEVRNRSDLKVRTRAGYWSVPQ
jgi:hypothetical protein